MRFSLITVVGVLLPLQCSARWLGIPTVPFEASSTTGSFSLKQLKYIIINSKYHDTVNTEGETLIPPTLKSFASTFSEDLASVLYLNVPVVIGEAATKNSIFITIGNASHYLDAAGRQTSEGYSIDVTSYGIVITGASPLGAWWATRTILQRSILSSGKLNLGSASDSPGWGIRGAFLDIARHYYPPEFLIEMCSYLSFFKQNTFHLHLSDSPSLNPDLGMEGKLEFYSAFRLNSPDPAVAGLNKRPNESYVQEEFENIQQKCASRGVTIIPEIEAPGHALVMTQWKPELALSTDFTLLNISHPETIPVMKTIWSTFLPWFHSKTVHLGADEYTAAVSDYNDYVNTMYEYICEKFNKRVRIWGTFVPDSYTNETNVNTNVTVQHWEYFEENPYWDFIKKGFSVLNSDDQFYAVAKWSGSYPQKLNITRIFHGAPDGGPTAPYIFDKFNTSNNPPKDSPYVLGQLPALWNDFGPNATSVIEAYLALREGLPALADKQWGGNLLMNEYDSILESLIAGIPDQNLDRKIASKTSTILSYDFSLSYGNTVLDKSGNNYGGNLRGDCSIKNSILTLKPGCSVTTPLTSKGRNYTLSFSIFPTTSAPGTLFSSPSSILRTGNGTIPKVVFITGNQPYFVNCTLPIHTWTDVKVVAINNATYFVTSPSGTKDSKGRVDEFTTTIGIYSNSFVWGNPMSIEAPIEKIGGDGFEGSIRDVVLRDGADEKYAGFVQPLVIGVAPYS